MDFPQLWVIHWGQWRRGRQAFCDFRLAETYTLISVNQSSDRQSRPFSLTNDVWVWRSVCRENSKPSRQSVFHFCQLEDFFGTPDSFFVVAFHPPNYNFPFTLPNLFLSFAINLWTITTMSGVGTGYASAPDVTVEKFVSFISTSQVKKKKSSQSIERPNRIGLIKFFPVLDHPIWWSLSPLRLRGTWNIFILWHRPVRGQKNAFKKKNKCARAS